MRMRLLFITMVLSCCLAAGCGSEPARVSQVSHIAVERQLKVGAETLNIAIADTADERSKGLMHVPYLAENEGMLFIYEAPRPLSFWMKNTMVPLDIAFLDADCRILNILQMQPLDESSHPSEGPAQYALEVNQGWFERHKVKAGDLIADITTESAGK